MVRTYSSEHSRTGFGVVLHARVVRRDLDGLDAAAERVLARGYDRATPLQPLDSEGAAVERPASEHRPFLYSSVRPDDVDERASVTLYERAQRYADAVVPDCNDQAHVDELARPQHPVLVGEGRLQLHGPGTLSYRI